MKKQIKILLLYGLLLLLFPFSVFALTGSIDELQRLFGGEHTLGATVLFPGGGGTGTSTAPTAGQLLRGKSTGVYELLATSTDGSVLWLDTNGYPAWAATSSLGVVGIVSTSTVPTISQLAYWTSAGTPSTLGTVATTSLTATSPLSLSQPISVIGGSASALSLSTAGDWTGTFDSQEGSYYLNANNLTNFGTPFWTFFNATTTTALAEGNNLYWTNNRFDTRLTATTTLPNLAILLGLTNASSTLLTTTGSTYLATTGGNVGIGTTSPEQKLTVNGNSVLSGDITVYNGAVSLTRNSAGGTALTVNQVSTGDILNLQDNGTEVLTVIDGGNVGIGETAPGSKLSVSGGATVGASYDTTAAPSNGMIIEGNVGIGTTTPTSILSLYQASADVGISLGNSNATMWTMGTDISDGSKFKIASSSALGTNDRLTIDTSGNVGIGTTGPAGRLHVQNTRTTAYNAGDYSTWADTIIKNPTSTNGAATGIGFVMVDDTVINQAAGIVAIRTGATDTQTDLAFITRPLGAASAERMRITRAGNVGIGTTSPGALFSVQGNGLFSGNIQVSGINATSTLTVQSTSATSTFSTGGLTVGTSQFVVQQTSGNVGIGTTTPNSLLNIASTLPRFYLSDTDFAVNGHWFMENDAGVFSFGTTSSALAVSATRALSITNAGNVGIGTTSPVSKLSVVGESAFAGGASVGIGYAGTAAPTGGMIIQGNVGIGTTTPNSLLSLYQASADTALTFGNSNATMWTMGTDISDGSKFKIASSSALGTNDRLTIDTNGNVGIGTTGPIYNLDVSENSALASIYTDFPVVRVINPSAATHSFSAMEVSANNTTVIGDLLVDGLGTGSAILGSDAGVILMSRSNHILALGVNDTEKMRIDTTGNVGIGTTSPTTLIQAGSTATTTISALSSSGDKGGRLILMDTNGSTCTEITTNAGAIIGKVVTCP